MKGRIRHATPNITQEDIARVVEVLSLGQLTSNSEVSEFEREVADYIGQDGGISTNSGNNALYLALLSLGSDNKDEVIIPSFVCIALLRCILQSGLKPRLVDINENGYNISLDKIKENTTRKTKAIIAPHMFGDPIENIEDIVNLGMPVIEDCALSIGAAIDGKKVGSFSELSIFSFYATKVLTTGHGGMVLSSSEELLKKLRDFMRYDNREEYGISFNFRLTDFQAALGRSQLLRLDDFIKKRREIAEKYDDALKGKDGVRIPYRPKGSIYYRYIIELSDVDKFIEEMSNANISCKKPVFKPLHHYQELKVKYPELDLDKKRFPNTERAFRHSVSIPIYPSISDEGVKYVIEKVLSIPL